MLNNQGQAASIAQLLASVDAANTAAATGAWTSIAAYEGDIVVDVNVGVVTAGSIAPKIQHADDDQGTNAADLTPNEGAFTTVSTSNDPMSQKRTYNANALKPYIRFVGTVTTGPAQVAVNMLAHPKYV